MPRPKTATPKKTAPRAPRVRRAVAKPSTVTTAPVRPSRTVKRTYTYAVGRRKEAVARVRWHVGSTDPMQVNGRPMEQYFPTKEMQQLVLSPLVLTEHLGRGNMTAKVHGGGVQGQAEAVRLGIARALVKIDADLRLSLKRAGYLHRDPRVKERKKYGLKRARRAPQWQKR
jgi:small subunit ribosomal protein S9